ncbi:MAG TPA: (d)CMP kinase [Candidatus Borkfalkia avistercoris]|mgnify:FL=1|uniref:Cytidylate kinase n=1 Tax=Candidatus Borkfalkia avistercoris TaxID=2838504 RepID=A0A9D2CZA6_9FIRM|nr:(d)CMP kinase [Candidatus Borkfalkia avistercoris]
MRAIRGATTIGSDCAEEIRAAVAELLNEIKARNALSVADILCILLSNTSDIVSFYPAKAAREAGFSSCALYSSAEPEIAGALPLCIRVLVFAEGDGAPKHVYLRGAANLRKDLKKYSVALDGPSGSGKSTVAKLLAKDLHILYLDTGAMYRACALKAIETECPFDEPSVRALAEKIDLKIVYEGGAQRTWLDGKDVSEDIRRPEVSMAASKISAFSCIREKMVEMQRQIAAEQSCVLDGRDIGTAVLPDAEFKFFVTADSATRAQRRGKELAEKGYDVDLKKLQEEIEERDRNDSTRAHSPLKRAEDAVLVDTSRMTIEEVVAYIKNKIQEKV